MILEMLFPRENIIYSFNKEHAWHRRISRTQK